MAPRDIAFVLLVVLVWGFNFVVMKAAVAEIEPLLLSAVRFGLAGLIGVMFVARPVVRWSLLAAYGLAFGVAKFGLLFTAFKLGMPAGLASIVLQLQAVFTVVLAMLLYRETPSRTQVFAISLALAGLAVIGYGAASGAVAVPVAFVAVAALMWALANLVIKRAGAVNMLGFTVWSSLWVPLPMLALSGLFEGPGAIGQSWSRLSVTGVAAIAYLVIPVSIVSGALWNDLLSRYPATAVVPYALLVPVVGILSAAFVYGETLRGAVLAGVVLCGLALMIMTFAPARRSTPPVSRENPGRTASQ
jgi:O-acetylserine/cysteine efflux transporter